LARCWHAFGMLARPAPARKWQRGATRTPLFIEAPQSRPARCGWVAVASRLRRNSAALHFIEREIEL
jgi:hypothetical protein